MNKDIKKSDSPNCIPFAKGIFSYFDPPISNTKPRNRSTTIKEIFGIIVSEDLKSHCELIRKEPLKEVRDKIKSTKLPYVTFSGTFTKRSNDSLVTYAGLVCCDLDHIGIDQEKLREKINVKSNPTLMFRSPSGDGGKTGHIDHPQAGAN